MGKADPNVRHLCVNPLPTRTHICVMSSHKPIRIYMGDLILGVNTLYRLFCFFKLFPMVGKGLMHIVLKPHINKNAYGVFNTIGVNRVFCFFKLFPMVGKALNPPYKFVWAYGSSWRIYAPLVGKGLTLYQP